MLLNVRAGSITTFVDVKEITDVLLIDTSKFVGVIVKLDVPAVKSILLAGEVILILPVVGLFIVVVFIDVTVIPVKSILLGVIVKLDVPAVKTTLFAGEFIVILEVDGLVIEAVVSVSVSVVPKLEVVDIKFVTVSGTPVKLIVVGIIVKLAVPEVNEIPAVEILFIVDVWIEGDSIP